MLFDFLTDYTLRTVALGAAMLGVVSGALGAYAVLRGQSLLGDAVSHAALPGIALAFLITGTKAPLVLLVGAALAGGLATWLIGRVAALSRVTYDSALGLMLAVFFGFGLVLLTYIQQRPDASQAGLDTFLFGQAAALVQRDVLVMGALGSVVLAGVLLFWKEFKLLAFDAEFGRALGLPMRAVDGLLMTLLVVAIVIGLQTVGVVLMSAMVVAPGAAARQWTDRLGVMVGLAAAFGAAAGVLGALLSSTGAALPTGPMIVVCMGAIVAVSLFLAPNRGLLWRALRDRRNARRLRLDGVLLDLYALAAQHERPDHPHDVRALDAMGPAPTQRALDTLATLGLVRRTDATHWALTDAGLARARTLAGAGGPASPLVVRRSPRP